MAIVELVDKVGVLMLNSSSSSEADPHAIRSSYLHLTENFPSSPSTRQTSRDHRDGRKRAEPEMAVAQAAGFLPGEYAAVRNVVKEMDRRLVRGWWLGEQVAVGSEGEKGKRPVIVEVSGGLGSGLW